MSLLPMSIHDSECARAECDRLRGEIKDRKANTEELLTLLRRAHVYLAPRTIPEFEGGILVSDIDACINRAGGQ